MGNPDVGRLAADGGERHSDDSEERGAASKEGGRHSEDADERRMAAEEGVRHSEHSGERGPPAEAGESHSVLAEVEGGYSITKQFSRCTS